jgi:uncharacterized protein YihD (DUF1040 family)
MYSETIKVFFISLGIVWILYLLLQIVTKKASEIHMSEEMPEIAQESIVYNNELSEKTTDLSDLNYNLSLENDQENPIAEIDKLIKDEYATTLDSLKNNSILENPQSSTTFEPSSSSSSLPPPVDYAIWKKN